MRLLWAALAAFLLAACASHNDDYEATDYAGNAYPAVCRGDLSYVTTPIIFVPRAEFEKGARLHSIWSAYGYTLFIAGRPTAIYIDDSLMGWLRDDIIRHERCHVLAGHWHK